MASGTNPFLLDIPDEWNSGLPLELSSISMHYAISENKKFLYRNLKRLDLVRSYKFSWRESRGYLLLNYEHHQLA